MKEELIRIYNSIGEDSGQILSKEKAHLEGKWHKTVHLWMIYQTSDGTGYILLQKRAKNKSTWPSKVDISVAGHIKYNEGTVEALSRELNEEIGLDLDKNNLVFFLFQLQNIKKLKPLASEVEAIIQVRLDDFLNLCSGDVSQIEGSGLTSKLIYDNSYIIKKNDLIPTLDNYFYKIAILAKRALANERHLLI